MAITFEYEGANYKLEVTPKTIKTMEKRGVDFTQLAHTVDAPKILWEGLFIAHHDTVRSSKREEIRNQLTLAADGDEIEYDDDGEPVDALMAYVAEMYNDVMKNLKRGEGNVIWKRA